LRILTPEFVSACSPVVSFDGKRVVFSGKISSDAPWNIWEMDTDGANKRRIVQTSWDCLTPAYLPSIYTLDNLQPRDQIVFACNASDALNECGSGPAWSLYTCELSGENLRRITFNLSADFDPAVLPDGRILFSSWQRFGTRYYPTGLFSLLTVNTDGTDLFPFYGNHELPILKCKPALAPSGWLFFVESRPGQDPLGGGSIAAVSLRRNMKSYTPITHDQQGLFFSPSPFDEKDLVVSYKPRGENDTYGLYKLSRETGEIAKKLFDDPDWHDIEAQPLSPRTRPKGRASVVDYQFDVADIYCLDCYITDRPKLKSIPRGSLHSLRVIEGIPLREAAPNSNPADSGVPRVPVTRKYSSTPFGPRRIIGEAPLSSDGSFYMKVPSETPVAFQLLDEKGTAVVTHQNWMWAMPKEARGCIGCHEDRELTPPNRLVEALKKPAAELNVPAEKRRTVDFQREIAALIKSRCIQCHNHNHPGLDLTEIPPETGLSRVYEVLLSPEEGGAEGITGRYIKPGSARESPLVWHLFGKRLDEAGNPSAVESSFKLMPPDGPLSDSERKLFVEWIDLGAQFINRPAPEDVARDPLASRAPEKGK